MRIENLTDEEVIIGETGHLGLIGDDAIKAYRGASVEASAEEIVLHAIGVASQNQPGALRVATMALEKALASIRNAQN